MAATPTTSDVLMRAAQRLMEHGWVQGQYLDAEKQCAMGAIGTACEELGFWRRSAAYDAFRSWLARDHGDFLTRELAWGPYLDVIARWNDHKHRTVEDVVLALKRAATEGA